MSAPQAAATSDGFFKNIGDALTTVTSAAALVFVSGGLVVMGRLYVYHVAGLEAVVGQIPPPVLLTTGLVEVVGPWLAVALAYAILRMVTASSGERWLLSSWPDSWTARWSWLWIFVLIGLFIWLVIVGQWLLLRQGGCENPCTNVIFSNPPVVTRLEPAMFWLVALIAIEACLTTAFLLSALVARKYGSDWYSLRAVALMTLVVSLASLPAFITFEAGLPLVRVYACVLDGKDVTAVAGFLVAQSGDDVFIALDEPSDRDPKFNRRLDTIPSSQVLRVTSGVDPKQTPTCPSPPGK